MKRKKSNQSGKSLWVAAAASGALALIAGTAITPEVLNAVSPDHSVSALLLVKWLVVRSVLVVLGALAFAAAAGKLWGFRGGLAASAVCVVWAGVVMQQLYPGNLFGRPVKLLQAILGEELLLSDYQPQARLVVPSHEVLRAKYPVINIHAHFRRWYQHWTPEQVSGFMDACNVERMIDLDGELGERLRQAVARWSQPFPGRFTTFASFGFSDTITDWAEFESALEMLDQAKQDGAFGVKIWKIIGLRTRDENGKRITLDDPRLDPLWAKVGALQIPMLIHVGDPAAFFDPIDARNERYEELKANPDWSFFGPQYPTLAGELAEFERAVTRHPEVTFILAHLANRTDDLSAAAGMLDRHPNLHMDISARISELGRQPEAAREFFIRYQDRLVFGTDGNPEPAVYRTYFRFLETADEYFDYPFWPQFNYGRWKIYGIHLPDEVLKKLYHDNAAKILGLPLLGDAKKP